MIVDMHIHLAGRSAKHGNHLSARLQNSRMMRRILKQNGIGDPHGYTDEAFDELVLDKVANQLDESRLDHGVVLALDAAYSPDGERMDDFSELVISNDFIVALTERIKNEHSLKSFDAQLNHISKIKTPLGQGVTVIAAHLGTRMFYHEKCFFKEWTNRVFFGNDFPATHKPLSFIHKIGLHNYFKIRKAPNAFNRSYLYYRALGVPAAVFSQFSGVV